MTQMEWSFLINLARWELRAVRWWEMEGEVAEEREAF